MGYTHQGITEVPVAHIQLDSANLDIHVPFDPTGHDAWLVNDIRKNGVLQPIALTVDGTCPDGRRRLLASKHLGRQTIPAFVADGDAKDMHKSAQLGRSLKVYAQCVIFRDEISEVMEMARMARHYAEYSPDELEAAFIQLESRIGRHRDTLVKGVALLDKIDGLSSSPRELTLGEKVRNTFRSYGYHKAAALLNDSEADEVETAAIEETEDDEVDVAGWVTEEDNDFSELPKRDRRKNCDQPEPSEESIAAAAKPLDKDQWAKQAYKALATVERLFKGVGILTNEATQALNDLEGIAEDYATAE